MRTTLPFLLAVFALSTAACDGAAAPPGSDPAGGVIRVTTSYPGANARVVADTIAAPIEQQVNGVEGMTRLESESRDDGSYTLTVRFGPRTDLDAAKVLVQNRVNLALPALPDLCKTQGVTVRKAPTGPPTFWLAVSCPNGKYDALYLANVSRRFLKDELARLPGVADVRVSGAGESVLRLWIDPDKLAARGLTAADVVGALENQNLKVAAGQVGRPPKGQLFQYTLTITGRLTEPDDLGQVIVKTTGDGQVVSLRDVARIEVGPGKGGFAAVNGKPAALLAVTPWRGKVTAEEIRKAVGGAAKVLKDVQVELVADLSAGGVLVVDVRLPESASQVRTMEATARASRLVRELPGSPDCLEFGEDREPNAATLLVKLPENNRRTVASIRDRLGRETPGAVCRVSEVSPGGEPFPVRIAVCDTGDKGEQGLREVVDAVAKQLAADAAVTDMSVSPGSMVSKLRISLDRAKLKELGVSAADVAAVIRIAAGGGVNDFSPGRDPVMQLDLGIQTRPDDLAALKVRGAKGEMVPLNTIAEFRMISAESVVTRVNLYPALILTANPADGTTPAHAAARCLELAGKELPKGYRAENLTRPAR
ncbi:MAG: hypothetical protein JWO38_8298 [Gemmataceae bacterium]|nr:hypothetical protein [Gemmataceae bacterium]